MKFAQVTTWIEEHPGESIAIGAVGALVILWLLGAFSSAPAASTDTTQSSMAAAYYAAEAQQAVVGGQIQVANIEATAATGQTLIAARAATLINGQNVAGAITTTNSNNLTAAQIDQSNNNAGIIQTYLGAVFPAELAQFGNQPFYNYIPGVGGFDSSIIGTPDQLRAAGYGEDFVQNYLKNGLPGLGTTSTPAPQSGGVLVPGGATPALPTGLLQL